MSLFKICQNCLLYRSPGRAADRNDVELYVLLYNFSGVVIRLCDNLYLGAVISPEDRSPVIIRAFFMRHPLQGAPWRYREIYVDGKASLQLLFWSVPITSFLHDHDDIATHEQYIILY